MGCGCVPYVVSSSGQCNQTYSACAGSGVSIPITGTCAGTRTATVTSSPEGFIVTVNPTTIVVSVPEDAVGSYTIEYTVYCNGTPIKSCTVTLNIQEANEGAHTISLNACNSTCTGGLPTTYQWTGFTEGCIELHPDYSEYDCEIKVIVFDGQSCSINLKVCCGNCGDNCCTTTHWTWNSPEFNDNCIPDCSMYPCTTYNAATGNCEPTCDDCETCCEDSEPTLTLDKLLCTYNAGLQAYTVTLQSNAPSGQGIWLLAAKTRLVDAEPVTNLLETEGCIAPIEYQEAVPNGNGTLSYSFTNSQLDGSSTESNATTCYFDNFDDPDVPSLTTVFVGYTFLGCTVWYTLQVRAGLPIIGDGVGVGNGLPVGHLCLNGFIFTNTYYLHNNLEGSEDVPLALCSTGCAQASHCAECCSNAGCELTNCIVQPVCHEGTCNCMLNGIVVPALPNGCCPSDCVDTDILPACTSCVNGVITLPTTCSNGQILNQTTCICECPSGTTWNPVNSTCQITVGNCTTNPSLCTDCQQCNGQGACEDIDCGGVGAINNPNVGDCCIPDPCPGCDSGMSISRVCTDILPKRADVQATISSYVIKFTQILAPAYSLSNCSYDNLNSLTSIANLPGAVYHINYTNYTGDWVQIFPSGNNLVIPIISGNGFLIKCEWHGREVVYEFIFEEGYVGTDVNNLGNISIKQVYTGNCKALYRLFSPCGITAIEWFEDDGANEIAYQDSTALVAVNLGLSGQLCATISANVNNVLCEDMDVCTTTPACSAGCGCETCPPANGNFVSANIVELDNNNYYASVFRTCSTSPEAPLMFTCAPPTAAEYAAYILDNDDLPNACGTLPQMFSTNPTCSNCLEFDCCEDGTCSGASLCGWNIDIADLVPNSLLINGANISFELLPDVESTQLCFGTSTECGYACNCIMVTQPVAAGEIDIACNTIYSITSIEGANREIGGVNILTLPVSNEMVCDGILSVVIDYQFQLQMDRMEVFYNNVLVAATPYVGAICNNLGNGNYIEWCDGITSTDITTAPCFECGYYENINLAPSTDPAKNNNACNSTPPIWGGLSPLFTFASLSNTAGKGRLRVNVPYNGTNELVIKVHNNPDAFATAASDGGNGGAGTGGAITQPCTTNGLSVTDWLLKVLCNTCTPPSCPPPVIISNTNDCEGAAGEFEVVTSCSVGTIQYSYSTNNTNDVNTVVWSAWTPTLPTWVNGLWLRARCTNNSGCTSIISNIVRAEQTVCDCNLTTNVTYVCSGNDNETVANIVVHIIGGTAPYTITAVVVFDGNPLSMVVNVPVIGQSYTLLNSQDANGECVTFSYTVTDFTGDCSSGEEDVCITCPTIDATYNCVNNTCYLAVGGGGTYATFEDCAAECQGALTELCDQIVEREGYPGETTNVIYNINGLTPNEIYYIDAAFGGKPERYKIYQVDAFNQETLIATTPFLGCGCTPTNKAISGFWTNANGLTQSGDYDALSVASCTSPFVFGITAANYAALDYSGYNSGDPNEGYTYDFIPNNSTWTNYYDNNCDPIVGADYNTCGTCIPNDNYEEINAKALGRIYFKYLPAYGGALRIQIEHGILNATCPPHNTVDQEGEFTQKHGVKFNFLCENTPVELCKPITGTILGDEPANPPAFERYEYAPYCEGKLNLNINLTASRENNDIIGSFSQQGAIPNYGAVNVGVGYKTVKGKTTNTIAYIYQVEEKKPLRKLKKADRIPKEINGIPTDVIIVTEAVSHVYDHLTSTTDIIAYKNGTGGTQTSFTTCGTVQTCFDYTYDISGNHCNCPTDQASARYNGNMSPSHNSAFMSNYTVYGGVGIVAMNGPLPMGRGTMSFIAKETSTKKLVGVTNNHVISSTAGTPTYGTGVQTLTDVSGMVYKLIATTSVNTCFPGASTLHPEPIATSYRVVTQIQTTNGDSVNVNYVDAGIVEIAVDYAATDIHEIGQGGFRWVKQGNSPSDDFETYAELIGKRVYKSGGTTGTKLEIGQITNAGYQIYTVVDATHKVHYFDQLIIQPISPSLACQNILTLPGDSGSPILVEFNGELKIIGINWGGNSLAGSNYMVISPIWRIAELAGIEEWDGTIIADSSSPIVQLTKNNKVYLRGNATSLPVTHTTFTELTELPNPPCN